MYNENNYNTNVNYGNNFNSQNSKNVILEPLKY